MTRILVRLLSLQKTCTRHFKRLLIILYTQYLKCILLCMRISFLRCIWHCYCANCCRWDLLFCKKFLKILVLAFKCLIFTLNCSFFFFQFSNNQLQVLNFFPLFNTRSDCTFSILKSLTCFLVLQRVVLITENAIFI